MLWGGETGGLPLPRGVRLRKAEPFTPVGDPKELLADVFKVDELTGE